MDLFQKQQNLYDEYFGLYTNFIKDKNDLQKRQQNDQNNLQNNYFIENIQAETDANNSIKRINSQVSSADLQIKSITTMVGASKFSFWNDAIPTQRNSMNSINISDLEIQSDTEHIISTVQSIVTFLNTGSNGAGMYVVSILLGISGIFLYNSTNPIWTFLLIGLAIPILMVGIYQTLNTQNQKHHFNEIIEMNHILQAWKDQAINQQNNIKNQKIAELTQTFNNENAALLENQDREKNSFFEKYRNHYQNLLTKYVDFNSTASFQGLTWENLLKEFDNQDKTFLESEWFAWLNQNQIINTTRIGSINLPMEIGNFAAPVFANIPNGNILVLTKGSQKEHTSQFIRSIMLRLLITQQAGQIQFVMFDPVGHGENIAAFMGLKDFDPELVSAKAWSDMRDIEQQLHQLVLDMDYVIQENLRKDYNSVEEYNANAGQMRLPYRIVSVFDFPVNFSDDSARRLISLIMNGPRCGICSIVMVDTQQPLNRGISIEDIQRNCKLVIDYQENIPKIIKPNFSLAGLKIDVLPPQDKVTYLLNNVGERAKENKVFELPIVDILPKSSEDYWTYSTKNGIKVPIGVAGANKLQYIELVSSNTQVHALVAGLPGSGKTVMVHDFILASSLMYPPSELEFFLIDMNEVGFAVYSEYLLPQARVVAVNSGREYGLSVIRGLVELMHTRQKIFRGVIKNSDTPEIFSDMFNRANVYTDGLDNENELEENTSVDEITKYREKYPEARMPRILLIIDEFQELFREGDAIATAARSYLDELTKLGRKFGIHLLLITQTLRGIQGLSDGTLSQIAVRIAFRTTEADSRIILEDNPRASHISISSKGRGIYSPESGKKGSELEFQAANSTLEDRADIAVKAQNLEKTHVQFAMRGEQIIFNGDAFANIAKHKQLNNLFAESNWPSYSLSPTIWLGEPLAIKVPTNVMFAPQSGSNMLIVTEHETRAIAMFYSISYSLFSSYQPSQIKITILDFNQTDSAMSQLFNQMPQNVPYNISVVRRRELERFIDETFSYVHTAQTEEQLSTRMSPHFIFIFGIHNARDIYQDSFSELGEKFKTVVQLGPELNLHIIAWCDRASQIRRVINRLLIEFDIRIVFPQPTTDDSNVVIDSRYAAVGSLRDHRAILWNSGRTEEFCPFSLGSCERWVAKINQIIQNRIQN